VKLKIISLILVVLICCGGCSFFKKQELVKGTPEGLFARGTAEYQEGNYKKAREFYLRLKEEHPLHQLAILAEMGIADSFYTDKDYLEAENAYRDFVTLHPTNENVPYALYQTAMCHYVQIEAIDRDQTETIKAKNEFERLVARFPESKFSTLAEKMIQDCKQKLAEKEFYVGKFYLTQKNYRAALGRFEHAARNYSGVGVDHKIEYYITETKANIAEEEKSMKEEADKQAAKEQSKKEKADKQAAEKK
jgi:outer membrane protein assembly factor BamD